MTIRAVFRRNDQHCHVALSNCYLRPQSGDRLAVRVNQLVKFHHLFSDSTTTAWCVGDMAINNRTMQHIQADQRCNWSLLSTAVYGNNCVIYPSTIRMVSSTASLVRIYSKSVALHTGWACDSMNIDRKGVTVDDFYDKPAAIVQSCASTITAHKL
jgi:hypothetical protein